MARLKGAKRQNNQLQLAFEEGMTSEARSQSSEGTEAPVAKCSAESLAPDEQWLERICQRGNLWQALKRVKGNGGSPGIDGMTVDDLPGYLKQHWLGIREQLLSGIYQPQPVRRVEIPKPDGGVRKLGVPTVLGWANDPAGGDAGSARQVGITPSLNRAMGSVPDARRIRQWRVPSNILLREFYRWVVDLDLESSLTELTTTD